MDYCTIGRSGTCASALEPRPHEMRTGAAAQRIRHTFARAGSEKATRPSVALVRDRPWRERSR